MAILGMDGFDHYTTATYRSTELNQVEKYNAPYEEQITISETNTRFSSGKRLRLWNTARWLEIGVGSDTTNGMTISFAYRIESEVTQNENVCQLRGVDERTQVALALTPSRSFYFTNYEGSITSLSAQTISVGTWYWVELKVVVDGSAGSVHLRVNGENWIPYTSGLDTLYDATTPLIADFRISGNYNCYSNYDDLVWQDDAGDFIGDSRIETFTPTGDNSVTWDNSTATGTNASHIDEIPAVDTDYVYTATSGEEDLYGFNTITQNDAVHGISLKYRAKKSDTGARTMQSRTSELVTGTDVQGGAENALATDWIWYSDVFETTDDGDPDAGTAWTKQLIEDATFGIKVTA